MTQAVAPAPALAPAAGAQVITSIGLADEPDVITLLASTTKQQARGAGHQRLTLKIKRVKGYFTGTGE